MAAPDRRRLVAEFRCRIYQMHQVAWTTFHHGSSYECGECKEGSVHLTLTLTTIFYRCQQNFNCRQSLNQSNSNKPPLQKRPNDHIFFQRKLYNNYVFCVVYCLLCCIVCCASQYCVVPTFKCKFVQQNLFIFHKNLNIYFL